MLTGQNTLDALPRYDHNALVGESDLLAGEGKPASQVRARADGVNPMGPRVKRLGAKEESIYLERDRGLGTGRSEGELYATLTGSECRSRIRGRCGHVLTASNDEQKCYQVSHVESYEHPAVSATVIPPLFLVKPC